MQHIAFRLTFKGSLHLGTSRADSDLSDTFIHSDTMYAALTRMWSMLGMPIGANPYADFAVSSLFPFAKVGEKYHYFFPKPFLPRAQKSQSVKEPKPGDAKKWKKMQWVDHDYFHEMLQKPGLQPDLPHLQGKFLLKNDAIDEQFEVYHNQVLPRNSVSRVSGATTIYYIDKLYFKQDCGLWFLMLYDNEATYKKVTNALCLLQDEGLGTDRNIGMGQFDFESTDDFPLDRFILNKPNGYTAISLFCPSEKSDVDKEALLSYELIRRGGWVTEDGYHTYRKKSVYMFKEGSSFVFQPDSNEKGYLIKGKEDLILTPEIMAEKNARILRCGKAIFFPCRI